MRDVVKKVSKKPYLIIAVIVAAAIYLIYTGRLKGLAISTASAATGTPPEQRIAELSNYIKNDPAAAAWKQHIQEKATAANISFNTQLRLDVIWALQQGGE